MQITVLAGGVGSGRLLAGLVRAYDPGSITAVVNVGDDERIRGLHVSPDIDTILYHLAGACDWDRGWGLRGDTTIADENYKRLAAGLQDLDVDLQDWFMLGDGDLATHLLRTQLLEQGLSLSEATDALRRAMGLRCTVLPATDDALRTMLRTADDDLLEFQEYFVRRRQEPEIAGIEFSGAARPRPAPGVVDAIEDADLIVIPPSNPFISIEPLFAISRLHRAVQSANAPRVAVSPIVGGRAIKGPAARLLQSMGSEVSAVGVAQRYEGIVDVFVLDTEDEHRSAEIEDLGMRAVVCNTIMRSPQDAARLAKLVVEAAMAEPEPDDGLRTEQAARDATAEPDTEDGD